MHSSKSSQTLKRFFSSAAQPVYIVAAKRTPIGSFLGKLSGIKATELSSIATRAALASKGIDARHVDEVILGNVVSSGLGQHPARQAALGAGLPQSAPVTNINKVCSSGMKSVILGAQSIALGNSHCVVTGGFESMSNIPFYVTGHRKGTPYGNQQLLDGIVTDGLTDVYNNCAMGLCGEKTASDFGFTREVQDAYCISSYERTLAAAAAGRFADQIVPVKINDKETVTQDEEPQKFRKDKIPTLRPAFSKTGTITAANSSKINDGACSIILMSESKVKELGLSPLARIVSYGDSEVDPMDFCVAPATATQRALARAGMKQSQLEYYEFNEAFSVTALANMKLLDIDISRINVNGGAVALGHPIGTSGARIIQSLVAVLGQNKGKYGVAAICNGGGGGSSIIVENLQN